jgi:hypothetical protein
MKPCSTNDNKVDDDEDQTTTPVLPPQCGPLDLVLGARNEDDSVVQGVAAVVSQTQFDVRKDDEKEQADVTTVTAAVTGSVPNQNEIGGGCNDNESIQTIALSAVLSIAGTVEGHVHSVMEELVSRGLLPASIKSPPLSPSSHASASAAPAAAAVQCGAGGYKNKSTNQEKPKESAEQQPEEGDTVFLVEKLIVEGDAEHGKGQIQVTHIIENEDRSLARTGQPSHQ